MNQKILAKAYSLLDRIFPKYRLWALDHILDHWFSIEGEDKAVIKQTNSDQLYMIKFVPTKLPDPIGKPEDDPEM
jgi:hypothetical protein